MVSAVGKIFQRDQEDTVKTIDSDCKNKFKWAWGEKLAKLAHNRLMKKQKT